MLSIPSHLPSPTSPLPGQRIQQAPEIGKERKHTAEKSSLRRHSGEYCLSNPQLPIRSPGTIEELSSILAQTLGDNTPSSVRCQRRAREDVGSEKSLDYPPEAGIREKIGSSSTWLLIIVGMFRSGPLDELDPACKTALAQVSMSSTLDYRPPAGSKKVFLKKHVLSTSNVAASQSAI